MASYETFMALRDYVKGKIDRFDLEDSDPNIYDVKEDKSNLGQSLIKIEFKRDDDFWKSVGLHEDDVWFMNMINSYYSDYEFMDWYAVKEDFENGYNIFYDLNDDNIEKLKRISRYIYPKKFDLEDENFRSKLAEKLLSSFKKETEDILSDYQNEKNREMSHVAREHVNKELNEHFNKHGFNYNSDTSLTTSVANLIMWYIKENQIHLPIDKLLHKIFESETRIGGWSENSYEYQDDQHFDKDSFNNYTERKLDEILEKIEDGGEGNFEIQEYLDMVERVGKKFEVDKWHNLPKKKDVRFKIENFEMNPNRIIVNLSKALKQRKLKLTEENFYHLLYQPTLFNLEEI